MAEMTNLIDWEHAERIMERCRDQGAATRECIDILVALAKKHTDPEMAHDAATYILKLFDDAAKKAAEKGEGDELHS